MRNLLPPGLALRHGSADVMKLSDLRDRCRPITVGNTSERCHLWSLSSSTDQTCSAKISITYDCYAHLDVTLVLIVYNKVNGNMYFISKSHHGKTWSCKERGTSVELKQDGGSGCVLNMISDVIPRGSLVTMLSRGIPGGHGGREFTQTGIIIHKW